MSSIAVRTGLKNAWPGLVPTIPLFDTINEVPSNLEVEIPIWATFVFDVVNRGPITMGSNPWVEEVGTATVALMGESGVGDDAVAQAAQTVIDAWGAWISASKDLWVQSIDGPRPPDPEAVGDIFRLAVIFNYHYQTRGGS
jgi:hypothetical protein